MLDYHIAADVTIPIADTNIDTSKLYQTVPLTSYLYFLLN